MDREGDEPAAEGRVRRVVDRGVGGAGPVVKDRVIADLAGRQFGVVSRAQLLAAGIGPGAIDTRLRGHRLHRLHRGVYAVGHQVLVPLAREMAAVLACGEGAAVSHRSAAAVWRLLGERDSEPVDVTTAGSGRSRPGLRVHRTTRLAPEDVRRITGLPVTSPARTLIDMAETAADRELERAMQEALTRRLVSPRRVLAAIAGHPGRHGASRLKRLLDSEEPATATRSEAEERYLALVRAAELPPPEVNVTVRGHEIDFLWREQRLVVEIDGFRFHSSRAAFEHDRRRDAELQSAGLRVLRITWRQLVETPYAAIARTVRLFAPG